MRMPGFGATASLLHHREHYQEHRRGDSRETDVVVPALRWGDLSNRCLGAGWRRYSAILWDIPWGQSWESTCSVTPGAEGTPVAGQVPTRCVNTVFNIWGEWDLRD